MNESIISPNPIIDEICDEYSAMRSSGKSRRAAISCLKSSYSCELNDPDDAPYVKLAFALALCINHELTSEAEKDGVGALNDLSFIKAEYQQFFSYAESLILSNGTNSNPPKTKPSKRFSPNWNIGDTFLHTMTGSTAENLDLKDWGIVVRKIGDYIDNKSREVQLVTLSLCPPDKIASISDCIDTLGYLKMMHISSEKSDYLAQICITKANNEAKFELQKIGCFPVKHLPSDQAETDIRVAMPLFCIKDPEGCIHYESIVCSAYRRFGICR